MPKHTMVPGLTLTLALRCYHDATPRHTSATADEQLQGAKKQKNGGAVTQNKT